MTPNRKTEPPGTIKKRHFAGCKDDHTEEVRSAFTEMEQPFLLTVSGNRAISLEDWMLLVEEAVSSIKGLRIKIDGFAQKRDRSIHLAVYGLKRHREAEFVSALYRIARRVRAKKKFFLVVGGSLSYFWKHSEYTSKNIAT
jgi:hypothetical protein